MILEATIVPGVRTERFKHEDEAQPGGRKRTKLSPEELIALEKRSKDLVAIINKSYEKNKKVAAAIWEEWGFNCRARAKHHIAALEEEIRKLNEETEKLQTDNAYLEHAIRTQADAHHNLLESFKVLEIRCAELDKMKKEMSDRIDHLEACVASSKSESEINKCEKELLQERCKQLSQSLEQSEAELKKEKDKFRALEDKFQSEAALRAGFQAENARQHTLASAQAAELRLRMEQEAQWKRQLEAVQGELEMQKLQTAKAELELRQAKRISECDSAHSKGVIDALIKDKVELQATIDRQTRNLAACITERDALREVRDDRAKLLKKLSDLEARLGALNEGTAHKKFRKK